MRRRVKNVIQLRVEEKQVLTFVCDKLRDSITYRQILSTVDKIYFFCLISSADKRDEKAPEKRNTAQSRREAGIDFCL